MTIGKDSKYISKFGFKKIEPLIHFDEKKEHVLLEIDIKDEDFINELKEIFNSLKSKFNDLELSFSCSLPEDKKISSAIKILNFELPHSSIFFSNSNLSISSSTLSFSLEKELHSKALKMLPKLKARLNSFDIDRDIELVERAISKEIIPEVEIEKREEGKKKETLLFGKEIRSKAFSIKKIENLEVDKMAVIKGEVFNLKDIRKGNIYIYIFNLNIDDKMAISAKFIAKSNLKLKDGMYVKIRAKKEEDNYYKGEISYNVSDLSLVEREEKKEFNKEDRVEFNAKTKMSEMGSILDISSYVTRAHNLSNPAAAITDLAVVHGFPEFHKHTKGKIKAIYGLEGYMVENKRVIFNHNLDEFISFDLETTGFNPYKHKIIEIGAVRVKKGQIVEKFQRFVNPEEEIPDEIIELTGITDKMVEKAPKIEEVLPEFLEFINNSLLVAHNAEFDMSFITVKAGLLGLEVNNDYIDSLEIARAILVDNKKHGLKELSKTFGLEFRHHRAIDDAETTAKILLKLKPEGVLYKNVKNTYPSNVLIYAKNLEGLKAIYELVSISHIENFKRVPRIPKSFLIENKRNLIIGASFNNGELSEAHIRGKRDEYLVMLSKFYDFIEVSPIKSSYLLDNRANNFDDNDVKELIKKLASISEISKKPLVATSNARYLSEYEHKFIAPLYYSSNKRIRNRATYLRSGEELVKEFEFLGSDLANEIVFKNTVLLSEKFDNINPIPDGFYPPIIERAIEDVKSLTYKKMHEIYGDNEKVKERVDHELASIIDNGFAVLYLIAHKLVKKSLDDGYLVGSRGSVGSSVVAWLMGITEVNALPAHYVCEETKKVEFPEYLGSGVDLPKKSLNGREMKRDGHNISFEVFMGFEGNKVPDIDLNFSGEYQAKMHKYVEQLFGKQNVFKAGTISTLAKKNAFGYARKYFEENNINISRANIELYANKCENARKTTGQHPGGMIIVPSNKSIYEFSPIQRPANDKKSDVITTHFDYHVMDSQLVKLDILGHDDPTTLKVLNEITGVDPVKINIDDPDTIAIFSSTTSLGITPEDLGSEVATFGIPEFGTGFVRRMLVETKPKTFSELIKISGLSHGVNVWTNNAQNIIRENIATLSDVISVRDEIMTYLISKGLPKGDAFKIMEFVRKGATLKKPDKWAQYKELMRDNKIPKWYIESCEKINYLFPKGHAAAYVLMAVRIAYFKVHHPKAFYTAFLTRKADFFNFELYSKNNSIEKIKKIINTFRQKGALDVREKNELYVWEIVLELKLRKIKILPIDLYKSGDTKFIIEEEGIRAPFITLKGLGESVSKTIVSQREEEFRSIEDLKNRTKIPKTICDKMKEIGILELQEFNQGTLF